MSLVALGISPLMIIAGQLQAKFVQGFSADTDAAYKDSGIIIMESVTNIRTVASFSNEKMLSEFYASKLVHPYNVAFKKGNISGIVSKLVASSLHSLLLTVAFFSFRLSDSLSSQCSESMQ